MTGNRDTQGTGKLTGRDGKTNWEERQIEQGGGYRDMQRVKRRIAEDLIEGEQRNAQINTSLLVWGYSITACNTCKIRNGKQGPNNGRMGPR